MSDEAGGKVEAAKAETGGATARGWDLIDWRAQRTWLGNPPTAFSAPVLIAAGVLGLVLGVVVLALLVAGIAATVWLGYETFYGNERLEAAKVFFPVLVALIGGPVLIWRAWTAHVAARATEHQAATAREGHYTALFTRAVEQLGATREVKRYIEVEDGDGGKRREAVNETEANLEVRLGAIYALDRIARESERDHWPIVQVLCAYIRNPQNWARGADDDGKPRLRRDDAAPDSPEFWEWIDSIPRPRVDIQAALNVLGERPAERIALERARDLQLDLSGANLQRAVMNRAQLARADLSGAHLEGASLDDAHLAGAWLVGSHLEGASLDDAQLEGASLYGAHLQGARLKGAHLEGARLVRAHLEGASLDGVHLAGASLDGAHLEGASLDEAHLAGASLDGAHLEGASLDEAHLAGALLFDTDLSKASGLQAEQLVQALGDASTILPDGMEHPKDWPNLELEYFERHEWITRAERRADRPGKDE